MPAADAQLLAEFAIRQSDDAFRQLVARHADLVYNAALRQVGDAHLAEDVAQAAFIVLSRRARAVPPESLPGWLIKTTRYCARDALRSQARRRRHEHEAASRRPVMTPPPDSSATEIAGQLDQAMTRLRDRESTAIALRYLGNKPVADVAQTLGVSADAAQKIISRSLVKLRRFLQRRGIFLSTTAVLSAALFNLHAHAAPVTLAG